MAVQLYVGLEFADFEELKKFISEYQEQENVIFLRQHSQTVADRNKKAVNPAHGIDDKFKFSYIKYGCKHFGKRRQASRGIRPNQSTYKTGCQANFTVSVDREKNVMVIKSVHLEHNHIISSELYNKYPEVRRIKGEGRLRPTKSGTGERKRRKKSKTAGNTPPDEARAAVEFLVGQYVDVPFADLGDTVRISVQPSTAGNAGVVSAADVAPRGVIAPRQRVDNGEDIVVVSARRTPIGKAKTGSFKDTRADDLLAAAMKGVLDETKIPPHLIGDIVVGNVLAPGAGAFIARVAQFFCGIPETVPVNTVNRQCSSGLQAFINIAGGIKIGAYDIGMAAGVESMSLMERQSLNDINPKVLMNVNARDCLVSMGITSENVAEQFGILRQEQDLMGLQSQQKAARATRLGLFKNEIIPVTTMVNDDEGNEREITITQDDGIQPTTMEELVGLKPAFKQNGTTTTGNSSQESDGAAAVLVMKQSTAKQMGLPVLGVLVSFAVVGVSPSVMGIGPAHAIPEALNKAGLTINDIDIFEINEAFASQVTYCVKKLGIPIKKVNPLGGAIALGHPLGCTGTRQIATLLHELKRRKKHAYGVVSMCIGTGMGAAAVFYHPGQ